MEPDTDSLDDIYSPAASLPATTERTLGKFRPKLRPKTVKPVSASSKLPDVTRLIPPVIEPPHHASDLKSLDEKSSLPTYIDSSMINSSNLDTARISGYEPEALYSEPLVSSGKSEAASLFGQGARQVSDLFSVESLDSSQPMLTSVSTIDRFQPKGLASEDAKLLTSVAPDVFPSELHLNQEPYSLNEETVVQAGVSMDKNHVPDSAASLQTCRDKSEPEAVTLFPGLESLDDLFQSTATSIKQAGKFKPKLVARPKEKKEKRVSFSIPDAAETVGNPVDTYISSAQNNGTEISDCNSTEMEPSFLQMLCEGPLDDALHSSFKISDCNEDIQMGHGKSGEEDTSEIQGLESLQNIPSQPTSIIGKFQPKISAGIKNVKPSAPVTRHTDTEPHPMEAEPLEGHTLFPPDSIIDSVETWTCDASPADLSWEQACHVDTCTLEVASLRDNHVVGRETSPVSVDISKELPSHDAELTQQILNARSTSESVEDGGVRKSPRKSRKRTAVCNPSTDDTTHDDWDFDNPDISQIEEAHSDDEYKGEEMPKKQRVPRKSNRRIPENKASTRKNKNASEEPSSTVQEPKKKKFPHCTKRTRRQVNKVLLETPEDEIDPKQLRIKDLIMLAEAKERISNKEAAALGKSSSNQSSLPNNSRFDTDNPFETNGDYGDYGGEEDHNFQTSSTKLNYHSFMTKPSSSRWSKSETELLYQAIRQFGTDFEMMQKLFPGKTRHQVKLKFKNEERKHPLQVADALTHRSKDHSHFELVIQKLADEEKEKAANEKTTYDPDSTWQDMAAEKEGGQPEKEEQEMNDEGGAEVKFDGWEGGVQSPDKFNEYEEEFQWDANASSPRDMGKNDYDDY